MEVISIDGVEYVRASVLARRHRYTSDYIGQLCRSGKVEAKLVGRTWYVNPESVDGHKNGRYQKSSSTEKTSTINIKKESSRINVSAVPRGDTFKTIKRLSSDAPQYLRRIEWKPVKYEFDNSELLPPLKSEPVSVAIPVDIAGAEKVTIRKTSTITRLEAEPLPEVMLQGTLKINSVDDDFTAPNEQENVLENIAISSDVEKDNSTVYLHPTSKDRKRTVVIQTVEEPEPATEEDVLLASAIDPYAYEVPLTVSNTPRIPSFAPNRIAESGRSKDAVREVVHPKRSGTFATVGILFFCILLAAFSFITQELVATSTEVSITYGFEINI